MHSKVLATGLLVAGCVTAAAGGAYLAVRHNQAAEAPAISQAAPVPASDPAPSPVAETEAAVSSPLPAESPASVSPSAPARPEAPAPAVEKTRPAGTAKSSPRFERTPARPRAEHGAPPGTSTPSSSTAASKGPDSSALPVQPVETTPDPPARAPEPAAPPAPQFDEVVLPSSSVIGLEVETPLSSERSRIEDRVDARVTRDVLSAGRVAIPAGSRVLGSVTLVERGGKLKERARLGVRFHTLVLADGREVPLRSETIFRDGESPTGEGARKIGGAAIGGAILGGILGGGKGAAIGGAAGAAGGTAAVMGGDRNAATLPAGTIVTVRLAAPATIEIERR